jgi:hypothetical protein
MLPTRHTVAVVELAEPFVVSAITICATDSV